MDMSKQADAAEDETGKQGVYTVQALDNAISLLMLVADNPDLGLSDLSRKLGAGKARVYRQLKTLEERGLVVCSEPNRTYRLGLATLMLGAKASDQIDLVATAKSFLAQLGEELRETTQFRMLDGDESVCVASWEPVRDVRVQGLIGYRRPLHAASGKVFLAYLPEREQNRILSRTPERFTSNTLVDIQDLKAALAQIRRDGFGVSRGEVNTDHVSVTAPVFQRGGTIAGIINVAAPSDRMGDEKLQLTLRRLKAVSRDLTAAIGGTPPAA